MCPTRLSSLPGVASVPGGGGGGVGGGENAEAWLEGVAGGREAVDGIVSATLEASEEGAGEGAGGRGGGAGEGGETPHAVSGREVEPWWEGLCSKSIFFLNCEFYLVHILGH
jgi:hypothetical protein